MLNSFEEKMNYLSNLSHDYKKIDYKTIEKLASDFDPEIRCRCAEILALFPSEQAENILIQLLDDPKDLVRANACDSLYFSSSIDTLNKLMLKSTDSSPLVRGYAALSIADVCTNVSDQSVNDRIITYFKTNFKKERDEWVKLAVLHALILLGEKEYFPIFLQAIHDEDYRNRLFVLNSLEDLEISDCKTEIINHLKLQFKKETVGHIKSKIQTMLIHLESK